MISSVYYAMDLLSEQRSDHFLTLAVIGALPLLYAMHSRTADDVLLARSC